MRILPTGPTLSLSSPSVWIALPPLVSPPMWVNALATSSSQIPITLPEPRRSIRKIHRETFRFVVNATANCCRRFPLVAVTTFPIPNKLPIRGTSLTGFRSLMLSHPAGGITSYRGHQSIEWPFGTRPPLRCGLPDHRA